MCRSANNKPSVTSPAQQGLTLIELLVVVAVVVILIGLRFSAYASEKPKSKGVQCLNNLRQLSLAWLMYAEDNRDYFVYSADDGSGTVPYSGADGTVGHAGNNYAWAWSKLDFSNANPYNWDINADMTLRPLWQYKKDASIYKCPGDTSVVASNGVALPRIRSYSMNFFLGGFGGNTSYPSESGSSYPFYTRLTDLADHVRSPGAANTFLFIEERQDCINWGNFETDMEGYPIPPNAGPIPGRYEWVVDVPGASHDRAGGISFCDGHATLHKWIGDGADVLPIIPGQKLAFRGDDPYFPVPYSMDVAWLQNATVRPH